MQEMFRNDISRAEKFHIQWNDFLIDYSKNRISSETMELLQQLAKEVNLKQAISSYFDGDAINQTENRAVLHTALRSPETATVLVDGKNVIPDVFLFRMFKKNFQNHRMFWLLQSSICF